MNRSTTQPGYGWMHQQRRRAWAPLVASGRVRCARCGVFIGAGEAWDLGHLDDDRSRYAGPEHRGRNRATAGRREAPGGINQPRRASRDW